MSREVYAAIGTDGTRPVVWGLGATPELARADAASRESTWSSGGDATVLIPASVARGILAGHVSCDSLGIVVEVRDGEIVDASYTRINSVSLYWQSERELGPTGVPGWAYNVIDFDGQHESGDLVVGPDDDGGESLTDVRSAFAAARPEVSAQITRWDAGPEGGWRGSR